MHWLLYTSSMDITLLKGQINGLLAVYNKCSKKGGESKAADSLFDDIEDDFDTHSTKSHDVDALDIKTIKAIISQMAAIAMDNSDECKALLGYLDKSDFYSAPASTMFHGSFKGGLACHTLNVIMESLKMAPLFLQEWEESPAFNKKMKISACDIFVAALAHDLCKTNFYTTQMRNKKDDSGRWVQCEYFTVKCGNRNLGHGSESCFQLIKLCPSYIDNRVVLEAIKAHMGFSDLSGTETKNYNNLLDNPLVLLLQMADQMASFWWGC